MRISITSVVATLVLGLLAAGCQRADDRAEASAKIVAARAAEAKAAAPAPAPGAAAPMAQPAPLADEADHPMGACGGACGASCNGQCGPSCMAGVPAADPKPVPSDAQWAELKVEGMHCGGCARRIQNALAQLDGVVGSEVDLGGHKVRVAVKKGIDARAVATPAIDQLGYRVVE